MNPLTSPACRPLVKMCSSSWRTSSTYNFQMYTFVSQVVRRSTFGPFSNLWHCSVFHSTKKVDKWQTSRDTSNQSYTPIEICEDGRHRISSWLSTHSQKKQTACKRFFL